MIRTSKNFNGDITREAYSSLVRWKNSTDLVLLVEGARQVGKTYLVKKFAEENFKKFIYINLVEDSGKTFINLLNTLSGTVGKEKELLTEVLRKYDSSFIDDKELLVIIDEIQESHEVYNKIRSFNRYMNCRFIVTGSYLGRISLDKNFWVSSGDYYSITITPLTFREFLGAVDKYYLDLFYRTDLYGNSLEIDYINLKNIFDVYIRVGGYPGIVKRFLQGEDIRNLFEGLLTTFATESARYLNDTKYITMINNSFRYFATVLLKEKKGLQNNNLGEEFIKLNEELKYKVGGLDFSKKQYSDVLNWLLATHSIYGCNKLVNCDLLDIQYNSRFYFNDTGLLFYLFTELEIDESLFIGALYENYVCDVLKNKRLMCNFATFANYEIDFILKDYKVTYGIEVKTGKSSGKSVNEALSKGLIDKILYLKGDTYGGIEGDKITIPIYLFERFDFRPSLDQVYKKLIENLYKSKRGIT